MMRGGRCRCGHAFDLEILPRAEHSGPIPVMFSCASCRTSTVVPVTARSLLHWLREWERLHRPEGRA